MHRLLLPHARDGGEALRVDGDAFHHLRVLRLSPGEMLEVFDGKGRTWPAEVLQVDDTHALLRLGPGRTARVERPISLVQALPKADKLEFILQKGTELGAHAFYPALSERTVMRLGPAAAEARRTRWQRIVEEAARQCAGARKCRTSSRCSRWAWR